MYGLIKRYKDRAAIEHARKNNSSPQRNKLKESVQGHIILMESRGQINLKNQEAIDAEVNALLPSIQEMGYGASLFNPDSIAGKVNNVLVKLHEIRHKKERR